MSAGKMAVFGVPSAAGARGESVARAPLALRQAGLLEALRSTGAVVVNLSDLSLFPFRSDAKNPQLRNAAVVACAIRATADEMTRALQEGFPLVLGGDCTIVVGTLGGARTALGRPVGLVYLDANADLNTPATSPSGYLSGMALSLAIGRGPLDLVTAAGATPAVNPEHVALVGYRELDPAERTAIGDLGLALPAAAARRLEMRVVASLALGAIENDGGPVVVHLDVDLVGADAMPAKQATTPGAGLTWDQASELLARLVASPRVVALEVTELDPERDPEGHYARRLVALLEAAARRRFAPAAS